MKLVIDIDENVFTRLFDNGTEDYAIANDDLFAVAKSIRNGTPFDLEGLKRLGITIIEADKSVLEKINEKQDSLWATCKAWDEAIEKDGYVN